MNYYLTDVVILSELRFCIFLLTTNHNYAGNDSLQSSSSVTVCNHHGAEQTVAVLQWPRHQWVASPAGMCVIQQQRGHTKHCFWMNLYNFGVFDTVYLFVYWDIANIFHCAVFWATRYINRLWTRCSASALLMHYATCCHVSDRC